MLFNTKNNKLESVKAKNYLLSLLGKYIEIKVYHPKRTNHQSKARWLYLELVAKELNNQGQTFNIPKTDYEVIYTKDILYQVYWQTLRSEMYPGKISQLNTKEFSDLVEMVQVLFAKIFDIHINFPDWRNKT